MITCVLASIGSVGDALAESFVDSFKTELIADRVWRPRTQLELAIVEYVGWFNHLRLHLAPDDRPPAEFENDTLISHGPCEPAAPAHTHHCFKETNQPGLRRSQPGSHLSQRSRVVHPP